MAEATAHTTWTIVAADGEGDTADIKESPEAKLEQLLRRGVHELVGAHAAVDEYDLLIGGTVQENLDRTLEDAGLHDHSEVTILSKNVSRG